METLTPRGISAQPSRGPSQTTARVWLKRLQKTNQF